jgi:hypothetical protein
MEATKIATRARLQALARRPPRSISISPWRSLLSLPSNPTQRPCLYPRQQAGGRRPALPADCPRLDASHCHHLSPVHTYLSWSASSSCRNGIQPDSLRKPSQGGDTGSNPVGTTRANGSHDSVPARIRRRADPRRRTVRRATCPPKWFRATVAGGVRPSRGRTPPAERTGGTSCGHLSQVVAWRG